MAGFFFDTRAATSSLAPTITPGVPTSFFENLEAGAEKTFAIDRGVSHLSNLVDAYQPLVDAMNEGLPPGQPRYVNPFAADLEDAYVPPAELRSFQPALTAEEQERLLWEGIAQRRATQPGALGELPTNRAALYANVQREVLGTLDETSDILGRSTTLGAVGGFMGSVAAAMTDPINLATLPFGAGAASGILKTAVIEGAINAGAEALTVGEVADYYRELGLEMTPGQQLEQIGFAAAGGALFGGGLKGLAKAAPVLRAGAQLGGAKLLAAFDKAVPRPSADQAAARAIVERQAINADTDPYVADPLAAIAHDRNVEAAAAAIAAGRAPVIPDQPAARPRPPASVFDQADELDDGIHRFDPATLEVDAARFQFKQGGDEFGVSDRRAGVTTWDPIRSGQVLVWEDAGGTRFIVDGHQRRGLAARIAAQADGQQPRLYGALLREADGVSAEQARAIAAAKNIAEGTGSAIDAAKVLRVNGELLEGLPPRSPLVRLARDLVRLTDEAFGFVVNERVSQDAGAVVGRLVQDPGQQMAILGRLAELDPPNARQAEVIVRDELESGDVVHTQESLFGPVEQRRSVARERARVLDTAVKTLRRERAVFNTLVANEQRIAEAGNVLDTGANAKKADIDAQAIQLVTALATRKGALSDALTAAAQRLAAGGRLADASGDFVRAVRDASARGDFTGLPAGAEAGPGNLAAEGGRLPDVAARPAVRPLDEAQLDGFATPGGRASADQAAAVAADVGRSATVAAGRDLGELVDQALKEPDLQRDLAIGSQSRAVAQRVTDKMAKLWQQMGRDPIDTAGFAQIVEADAIRHAWKNHGPGVADRPGNLPLRRDDFAHIPEALSAPDDLRTGKGGGQSTPPTVLFVKKVDEGSLVVVETLIARKGEMRLKTVWRETDETVEAKAAAQGGVANSGAGGGAASGGSDGGGGVPSAPMPAAAGPKADVRYPGSKPERAGATATVGTLGLSDAARNQAVPLGVREVEDGGRTALSVETRPLGEVVDEFDADAAAADLFGGCAS